MRGIGTSGSPRGESGMTLLELLVAILVLGVLLMATARSLVGFAQTSAVNERRVEATALQQRLHEELQAIPWEDAGIYADVLPVLIDAELGVDATVSPPRFGTPLAPLVKLDAPDHSGCLPAGKPPLCAHLTSVPEPYRPMTIDDIVFDVYTLVTAIDRTGDGFREIKRFTTIVRWSVLGTEYEQVFESERAPTAEEIGLEFIPEVLFLAEPGLVPVSDDGRVTAPISLVARFNVGVTNVSVRYEVVDEEGDRVPRTHDFGSATLMDGGPVGFSTTLVIAPTDRIPEGEEDLVLELTATYAAESLEATRSLALVPEGDMGPSPVVSDVQVATSTAPSPQLLIGRNGADRNRLCEDLTVTAMVAGLEDVTEADGSVLAIYSASTASGIPMDRPTPLTGSDAVSLTLARGDISRWTREQVEQFYVVAANPDGARSTLALSQPFEVRYVTTADGTCP